MLNNIPYELQILTQWIVWKYEDKGGPKPTKVPYALDGRMASVNDPSTWTTFAAVCAVAHLHDGIGFVFTERDEYGFIDLDATDTQIALQTEIYEQFNSYSEISPNKGLHIIIKGWLPRGRRRSSVEIYSSGRYATFTGRIYGSNRTIESRQSLFTMLFEHMGGDKAESIYNGDERELYSDSQVINMARTAVNGEKFELLESGDASAYPSQSEADQALINIIAYYTQNTSQIKRIFRSMPFGQRIKAQRDSYLNYTINRAFDQLAPPIDIEGLRLSINQVLALAAPSPFPTPFPAPQTGPTLASRPLAATHVAVEPFEVPSARESHFANCPTGLVRELADYIYRSSPYQAIDISLAAAIALMAGICGRAFNVSGTGLNLYLLVLAETGTGKETMQRGIDKLHGSIEMKVPASKDFVGPGTIGSGQALVKYLDKVSNVFLSVLGEFTLTLKRLCNPRANSAESSLQQLLLDLYNKSGYGNTFKPMIYADPTKNTSKIKAPAFSILAESTPESFYKELSEDMILTGLLPRFIIIEYRGKRPSLNKTHVIPVSSELVDKLASLAGHAHGIMHQDKVVNVDATSTAEALLDAFNEKLRPLIGQHGEITKQLWSRAHVKAIKLASIFAIGQNMAAPCISDEVAEWAIEFVYSETANIAKRFQDGDTGADDDRRQHNEIRRLCSEYIKSADCARKYDTDMRLHDSGVIPYAYISRRALSLAPFKVRGTDALKRALAHLAEIGALSLVPVPDMMSKFGLRQKAYVVTDPQWLKLSG